MGNNAPESVWRSINESFRIEKIQQSDLVRRRSSCLSFADWKFSAYRYGLWLFFFTFQFDLFNFRCLLRIRIHHKVDRRFSSFRFRIQSNIFMLSFSFHSFKFRYKLTLTNSTNRPRICSQIKMRSSSKSGKAKKKLVLGDRFCNWKWEFSFLPGIPRSLIRCNKSSFSPHLL